MRAWRVQDVGEPTDVLVLEDVPAPLRDTLVSLRMSIGA